MYIYIYITKTNKNACMIKIAFHSKDLPLALTLQKTLNIGNIFKIKGKIPILYNK